MSARLSALTLLLLAAAPPPPPRWASQASGGTALEAVDAAGGTHAWAVGAAGGFRKTTDGGATWSPSATLADHALRTIRFLGHNQGWTAGDAGTLLATHDGGATWNDRTSADYHAAAVSPGGARSWVAGADSRIRRTVDQGTTWTFQRGPSPHAELRGIAFASDVVGVAVGTGGRILKTVDGLTWTPKAITGTDDFEGVDFATPSVVYAVRTNGDVVWSGDAGDTWPDANRTNLGITINAVDAIDVDNIWVAGAGGAVRQTTNGGGSWSGTTAMVGETLHGISFYDPDHGWVVGDNGAVARKNGTGPWAVQPVTVPPGTTFYDVHALDAEHAWLVGEGGHIYHWDGNAWSPQVSAVSESLRAVRFVRVEVSPGSFDYHGWAAGEGGIVLHTTNGGNVWTVQTASLPQIADGDPFGNLRGSHFAGPVQGWVVGDRACILRTTNGFNFLRGSVPSDAEEVTLAAVTFADTTLGWAVGAGSTVLKSTDGGATWSRAGSPAPETDLSGVAFVSATAGWVVGAAGRVWRTVDAGATWIPQTSGVPDDLRSVAFLNGRHGWAVGASGRILRTRTGGASWDSVNDSATTDALHALVFPASGAGWAVGAAGRILRFTDGQDPVGFTAFTGTPYDYQPPAIDGYVQPEIASARRPDTGWNRAFKTSHSDGTSSDHVTFQGLRHKPAADFLYLSFEVRNDLTFDDNDYVVLLFRANNPPGLRPDHTALDRRLEIFPVCSSTGACAPASTSHADEAYPIREGSPPRLMRLWRWDAGNPDPDQQQWVQMGPDYAGGAMPAGFDVKVRSWSPGANRNWSVEAKIPTTAAALADWITLADDFLFAFHVVRLDSSSSVTTAVQFSWPRDRVLSGASPVHQLRMPACDWGAASKTAAGPGVRFATPAYANVGVQGALPSDPLVHQIQRLATNTFVARVVNDSGTAASDVAATFRIANWGVSGGDPTAGAWTKLPGANPTSPQPIPADSTASPTAFTLDWNPNDTTGQYLAPRDHQCVLVELDSASDVGFSERSTWRNMNFVPASTFRQQAHVNVKGIGAPPAGGRQRIILQRSGFRYDADPKKDPLVLVPPPKEGERSPEQHPYYSGSAVRARRLIEHDPRLRAGETAASVQTVNVHAYRVTDDRVNILGTAYPIVEPLGGFGYVARHEGPVDRWSFSAGPLDDRRASAVVDVPAEGEVLIDVRVEAVEPGGCGPLLLLLLGMFVFLGLGFWYVLKKY